MESRGRMFLLFSHWSLPWKNKSWYRNNRLLEETFYTNSLDSKISAKVPSTYTPAFFTNNNTSNFSSSSSNYGTSVSNKSPPLKQKLQHKPGFANMSPLNISKTGGLPSFSAQVMLNKLPPKKKTRSTWTLQKKLTSTKLTTRRLPRVNQPSFFVVFSGHLVEVPHLRGTASFEQVNKNQGFLETFRGEKTHESWGNL